MFLPLLLKHPLTKNNLPSAVARYFNWHVRKFFLKKKVVHPLIGNTKINMGKNDKAALVNYYTGLYEFEDMCFILHYLRENDLMVDVGANIGVFSLLASGHSGCKSIAFEPIPATFKSLTDNIKLNNLQDKINANNNGLGGKEGVLNFTNAAENCINRVADATDTNVIPVQVKRLDDMIVADSSIASMILKVDVEGFETEVLNGAGGLLKDRKLKAIVIELNGSGEQFGFDENAIKKKLEQEGFQVYYYHPFTRSLSKQPLANSWGNEIYVRDVEFVQQRLQSAKPITILGKTF